MKYEKAIKALQEIINKQSPVYLINSPEKIYPDLIEIKVSAEEAALLTYIFSADGFKKLSKFNDENEIISVLKNEKNLNTKTAKDLAHAFITIFTNDHASTVSLIFPRPQQVSIKAAFSSPTTRKALTKLYSEIAYTLSAISTTLCELAI